MEEKDLKNICIKKNHNKTQPRLKTSIPVQRTASSAGSTEQKHEKNPDKTLSQKIHFRKQI